jgi:asparagine synthase (glutamine-hydrolysing)
VSGICGIVLRDRERKIEPGELLGMTAALGEGTGHELMLERGHVGLGARAFPGRLTGVAERLIGDVPVALAFHGSLFGEDRPGAGGPGEHDDVSDALLVRYLAEGVGFLRRLRGDFVVAVWDGRDETLQLASDRFRVHPLFYWQSPDGLVFASRMRSLEGCRWAHRLTVDPRAVVDVVASSAIPTPATIYREVRKLPAGHVLRFARGQARVEPYWSVSFLDVDRVPERRLAEGVRAALAEAVSIRLAVEQDPERIGTFLSGGIDSSTITALVGRHTGCPPRSFSIGFGEARFNEMRYARIAAGACGARHQEYFVTPRDVRDAIPVVVGSFDEPYANASAVPTLACARLAREHGVDVLYAGDGGDELFAGNERYATQRVFEYYDRVPAWLRDRIVHPLVNRAATATRLRLLVKGQKYLRRAAVGYPARLRTYWFFSEVPLARIFDPTMLDVVGRDYDPYAAVDRHYREAPAQTELDRQLYVDLQLAISDNDLFKVTRMTEAMGVAVRFPFLDHRLAELAARVPAELKMRGRRLRTFFKRAYADVLPAEIRRKTKHGFGLPVAVWLRTDRGLNELMRELVLGPTSVQRGYFRREALDWLLASHQTDPTSFFGTVLWNLMLLELWHRRPGVGTAGPRAASAAPGA